VVTLRSRSPSDQIVRDVHEVQIDRYVNAGREHDVERASEFLELELDGCALRRRELRLGGKFD
jgi:hypothetical protein